MRDGRAELICPAVMLTAMANISASHTAEALPHQILSIFDEVYIASLLEAD